MDQEIRYVVGMVLKPRQKSVCVCLRERKGGGGAEWWYLGVLLTDC